jgi:hypothetical protein
LKNLKNYILQCRVKKHIKHGFKNLKDIDENLEFTLDYLKEHVGLLAEGQWQDIIYGLDPEDVLMFESLVKSGDIFKNKARIRLSTIHGIKGG